MPFSLPKADRKEFVKWVAGMDASPNPLHVSLYHRAIICKAFPAYTLETAKHANAEVLLALELVTLAEKVHNA